jgi:hypothetical protein
MIVINPIVNPIPVYGHLTRDNIIHSSENENINMSPLFTGRDYQIRTDRFFPNILAEGPFQKKATKPKTGINLAARDQECRSGRPIGTLSWNNESLPTSWETGVRFQA